MDKDFVSSILEYFDILTKLGYISNSKAIKMYMLDLVNKIVLDDNYSDYITDSLEDILIELKKCAKSNNCLYYQSKLTC